MCFRIAKLFLLVFCGVGCPSGQYYVRKLHRTTRLLGRSVPPSFAVLISLAKPFLPLLVIIGSGFSIGRELAIGSACDETQRFECHCSRFTHLFSFQSLGSVPNFFIRPGTL